MVRYEAFRARCLLAALDHNNHTTRDDAKTKTTSEIRFHRKFNKNSWQWTVKRVKVPKSYCHIPQLTSQVITKRVQETQSVLRQVESTQFSQVTIAPVSPPLTSDLAKQQHSRTGTRFSQHG